MTDPLEKTVEETGDKLILTWIFGVVSKQPRLLHGQVGGLPPLR